MECGWRNLGRDCKGRIRNVVAFNNGVHHLPRLNPHEDMDILFAIATTAVYL